jgi:hypothetical protein
MAVGRSVWVGWVVGVLVGGRVTVGVAGVVAQAVSKMLRNIAVKMAGLVLIVPLLALVRFPLFYHPRTFRPFFFPDPPKVRLPSTKIP